VAVWYVTFSELGSVRNIWILAEQKQEYLLGINVTGALANVILNLCLIPVWGAVGAAVASIVTQFFTNVIMGFVFKPLRPNNQLLVKGLNPKNTVDMVKEFLPNRKK
jgi:PST family polysaccharide transporter